MLNLKPFYVVNILERKATYKVEVKKAKNLFSLGEDP